MAGLSDAAETEKHKAAAKVKVQEDFGGFSEGSGSGEVYKDILTQERRGEAQYGT